MKNTSATRFEAILARVRSLAVGVLATAVVASGLVAFGNAPPARAAATAAQSDQGADLEMCDSPYGKSFTLTSDNELLLSYADDEASAGRRFHGPGYLAAPDATWLQMEPNGIEVSSLLPDWNVASVRATVAVDLVGDGYAEDVRVVEDSDGRSKLVSFDDDYREQAETGHTVWAPSEALLGDSPEIVNLESGDVIIDDRADAEEVVYAAYHAGEQAVEVTVVSGDDDRGGEIESSYAARFWRTVGTDVTQIAVTTGEFDGDSADEIGLVTATAEHGTYFDVLDYEYGSTINGEGVGARNLNPIAGVGTAAEHVPTELSFIDVGAGDLDRDYREDLVLTWDASSGGKHQVGVQALQLADDGLHIMATGMAIANDGGAYMLEGDHEDSPYAMDVGDVDGDATPEVVVAMQDDGIWLTALSGLRPEGQQPTDFDTLHQYDASAQAPYSLSELAEEEFVATQSELWPHGVSLAIVVADIHNLGKSSTVFATRDRFGDIRVRNVGPMERLNATLTSWSGAGVQTPDLINASGSGSRDIDLDASDRDNDSINASLGASTLGFPTCFDTAESEVKTSMQAPPAWSEYVSTPGRWTSIGHSESDAKLTGESLSHAEKNSGTWSMKVDAGLSLGAINLGASLEYHGSHGTIEGSGRSKDVTATTSIEFGYHATHSALGQINNPLRCYNYSLQEGKGTVYEDVNAGVVADVALVKRQGAQNPDGTLRVCDRKADTELRQASESLGRWEWRNSAWRRGSDHSEYVATKFTMIRPDWSSKGLFRGKWATQSSTQALPDGQPMTNGPGAHRAVDGDLIRSTGNATQTQVQDKPWWQIDLGVTQPVSGVRILAPTQCVPGSCPAENARLKNVVVLLSDRDLSKHPDSDDPYALAKLDGVTAVAWGDYVGMQLSFGTYVGSKPAEARYVRVQRLDDQVRLMLTEVQVFGVPHIQPHEFPAAVDGTPPPAGSIPAGLEASDLYRVLMYNPYVTDPTVDPYQWVHVRGRLMSRPETLQGDNLPLMINPGPSRGNWNFQETLAVSQSQTSTFGEETVHGGSIGLSAGLSAELNDATGQKVGGIGVSVSLNGGYENVDTDLNERTVGTTISNSASYGGALSGPDDDPLGVGGVAEFPEACNYTIRPYVAQHRDESAAGFAHEYVDVNYIVPRESLDRGSYDLAACVAGSFVYHSAIGGNPPPTADDFTVRTEAGVPIDFDVLEHASDPDPYTRLTVKSVGALSGMDGRSDKGALQLLEKARVEKADWREQDSESTVTSTVRYTPPADNFTGVVKFPYTVTDSEKSATGTVTIVVGAPTPPLAEPDSGDAVMWGTAVIDVLDNDRSELDRELTVTAVSSATHGSAELIPGTGKIEYTPTGNAAPDSFTYTLSDGISTSTGEVSITNTWDAFKKVEVEGGDLESAEAIRSDLASGAEVNGLGQGGFVRLASDGASAVERVDFGANDQDLKVIANVNAADGEPGNLEVLVDSEVVATVPFVGKGGGAWSTVSALVGKHSGLHEVTVRNASSGTLSSDVDWVKFAKASLKPIAVDDTETVVLGATGVVEVLENDVNDYGHPLSVEIHSHPRDGTVSVDPDTGNIEYVALNNSHTDTFYYTVSDGEYEDIGRVDIVKKWDAYNLIEGEGGTEVGPMGYFPKVIQDPDASGWVNGEFGGAYVQLTSSPLYGLVRFYAVEFGAGSPTTLDLKVKGDEAPLEVLLDGAAIATVDLKADGVGPDTWRTVTVPVLEGITGEHDVQIDGGSSNIYLDWIRFNDGDSDPVPVVLAPTPADDTESVVRGESVVVEVLENDADPNQPALPLTVTAVTQGAHGTVTLDADGVVSYAASGTGTAVTDSFTYTVSNGTESATATVSMSITDPVVAEPPTPKDDAVNVVRGGSARVHVLSNDSDPKGLTLTVSDVTQGSHGAVILGADGVVTYRAPATGDADSFTYTVTNGAESATATVSVSILDPALAEPPTPVDDTVSVVRGKSVTVNVLANDTDPLDLSLAVSDVTQGSHGAVSFDADGVVTYTAPVTGDADSFTYTVTNGAKSATATVSVSILDPATVKAPVAVYDIAKRVPSELITIDVLKNDSDPQGLALTVTKLTQPALGTVKVNADGTVSYLASDFTPTANGDDSDSFTYTVSNGEKTATAVVWVCGCY